MPTEVDMKQAPKPKSRIGRARFLLEFFIAAVLLKVGGSGFGIIFYLFSAIGLLIAIWASQRRLRDIKRSEWWVMILIAMIPIGFFIGFFGFDSTTNAYAKAFAIAYMPVYLLWLGVLVFCPSAFPKNDISPLEKPPNNETREPEPAASGYVEENAVKYRRQNAPRMKRLNGWQRVGVVLSALWCLGVVGKTGYDFYTAVSFNAYVEKCCEEDKENVPRKEKKHGDEISWCEAAEVCTRATLRPTLPPVLALIALLFLPIAAGWLIAFLIIWTAKWIREGFQAK
jgi:uncharacterized membrane protein YhaH (DUF805 family)